MELTEPRNFVLFILLFFGGCMHAFRPPEPVTVVTPTTSSTEVLTGTTGLTIEFLDEQKVSMRYQQDNGSTEKESFNLEEGGKIADFIQRAMGAGGSADPLPIMIKQLPGTSEKNIQTLLTILRNQGIRQFKILTSPR